MDRKLASIQRILKLEPIPNADAIEKATVLGWSVVVKKGEFKVGDLVVYCEVDSVLPDIPETQFLAPKFRVKTVRLRGQISQGICFPLSVLPLIDNQEVHVYPEGVDVTSIFKVTKYEAPIPESMAGKMRGQFPSFIPKTDETRLQTVPQILERYKDVPFYVTEKLDGASVTFFLDDKLELHVCSRNTDLFEVDGNTAWRLAREYKLEEKLKSTHLGMVLQGEIVGSKIQGNPLNIQPTIYFFNAFNYKSGNYYNFSDFMKICESMDIPTVPIRTVHFGLLNSVDEMVKYATAKSLINQDVWAEGIVLRPLQEMRDEDLGRLSFKVINPEYLLNRGE